MAKQYTLAATKRERAGKGVARALRREHKTPAVIYGDNQEPVTITVPTKEVTLEYHKAQMFTTLCELDLDGSKEVVLARDVQLHPVTDNVLHVDFLRVTDKTKITVAVPVNFLNQEKCKGILEKGVLNVIRYDVDLVCRAKNMPDAIDIDLTEFDIGDSVKISDAVMPEGSEPAISDRDFTIASIAAPRSIEDIEAEEAEGEEGEEGAEGADGETAEGGEEKAAEEGKE